MSRPRGHHTCDTIIEIDDICGTVGGRRSSGYPVVAGRRRLSRTVHRDCQTRLAESTSPPNGSPVRNVERMR